MLKNCYKYSQKVLNFFNNAFLHCSPWFFIQKILNFVLFKNFRLFAIFHHEIPLFRRLFLQNFEMSFELLFWRIIFMVYDFFGGIFRGLLLNMAIIFEVHFPVSVFLSKNFFEQLTDWNFGVLFPILRKR